MDQYQSGRAPGGKGGRPGFVTALVLRCGAGDESALVALMELTYAPVRALLGGGVGPDTEADELVGRAFIHIWRQAATYDASTQSSVIAWLLDEAGAALGPATPDLAAS